MLSSNNVYWWSDTFANIIYHSCLHLLPVSCEPFHQQICVNGIRQIALNILTGFLMFSCIFFSMPADICCSFSNWRNCDEVYWQGSGYDDDDDDGGGGIGCGGGGGGGITLTKDNSGICRKTCSSATLSTTNTSFTGLGSNWVPVVRSQWLLDLWHIPTNCLTYGTSY